MQQQDSNKAAINSIERRLDAYEKTLSLQRDAIKSLHFKNEVMRQEIATLRNLALARVWTDLDGNSFTGVFLRYNYWEGDVTVKKVRDNTEHTILMSKLTPACQKMAIGLHNLQTPPWKSPKPDQVRSQ
jgi:hypothetical protein